VDDYKWEELTKKLTEIKTVYPDESDANVILVPDNQVKYEVLVKTMDASRDNPKDKTEDDKARLLFPNVVIAGGAM
jgi:biopolymer transport protein ExbD